MWVMETICDHCTWMTSRVLQRQLKQSVAEACQGNCEVLVPTSRHPWISMITDTSMSVYLKVVNNNKIWKSRKNLSSRDFAVGSPGSDHAVVLRSLFATYIDSICNAGAALIENDDRSQAQSSQDSACGEVQGVDHLWALHSQCCLH